jgi:putative DNA primase/helicase
VTVTPEQIEALASQNGTGSRIVFPCTDLGNAERLVAQHGEDLRYVPGLGWHTWEDCRWRRDLDGEVMRRVKLSARSILAEAQHVEDAKDRAQIARWALTSETEPRLRAAISLAQSETAVIARADDLDADRFLLNAANGTIDLRTGELRACDRGDLITLMTTVVYDREIPCPRWERFLGEIFAGDSELVAFTQRYIGYCLTGMTREEVLGVFWGFGGNGKSTLLTVMKRLLGEHAVTASFETFMRARSDRAPRNDLARLHRARLVTAAESGEGKRLDEATVKEITGRDTIAARFLYGEHFEFTPQFKLVLVTNHKPRVDGADDALWRRLRLVPFTENFEGREDKQLADTLEAEMSGILAWAVRGCIAWQLEGLGQPAAVTEATSEYRQEEDVLGAFLEERCVLTGEIERETLRDAFADYCRAIGEAPLAANVLGKQLARRGISKHKRSGTYRGVSLR